MGMIVVQTFDTWFKYNENRMRDAYNPAADGYWDSWISAKYEEYVNRATGQII